MKEYLNMSDVFAGKVKDGLTVNGPSIHGENHAFYGNMKDRDCAVYAAHAINSHDELVAEVERLRGLMERIISSANELAKRMPSSEFGSGYKQCALDTAGAIEALINKGA